MTAVLLQSGQLEIARAKIYRALLAGKALDPDRNIVHMSHVCSVNVDKQFYPVIDLREVIKTDTTAHGVNTIVILSPTLNVLRKIDYATQRPLYCSGDKLIIFGSITIDGIAGQGDVLTFSDHGKSIQLQDLDVTEWPMTLNKNRTTPPQ